jgi:hypothetical protein
VVQRNEPDRQLSDGRAVTGPDGGHRAPWQEAIYSFRAQRRAAEEGRERRPPLEFRNRFPGKRLPELPAGHNFSVPAEVALLGPQRIATGAQELANLIE